MAVNKNTIITAVGCPHLTMGKAGLHQYFFEYNNPERGIYMQRKTFHVRKLTQFTLEKWAELGQQFVATLEAK